MKNKIEFSKIPHPLIRDGRSQDERQVATLSPEHAPVDNRSMADLLNYIYHYAKQIHFYNEKNKATNNWQAFFELSDPFQVAKISQYDIQTIKTAYQNKSLQLTNEPIVENLLPLLDRISELAMTINSWGKNLQRETLLKSAIQNIISSNLQYAFKEFIGYANVAYAKQWMPSKYPIAYSDFSTNWNLNVADRISMNAVLLNAKGSTAKQLLLVKDKLDDLFNTFLKAVEQIKQLAPHTLQLLLDDVESQNHAPHIALLLAFLRMFEQTRDDLNLLTKRHLDFFYKKILKLQTKEAALDQAHLVFKLAPNRPNFELPKGTQFSAGDDDLGAEMIFETEEDIVLSQAQVAELKTLYLQPATYKYNGAAKLKKDEIPRLIEGVYAAPIANSADGLGEGFTDENNASWEALGNSISKFPKEENPNEMQATPFAQQGFVMASRVLLLNEGDRFITLKIPLSFDQPVPSNFAERVNSSLDVLQFIDDDGTGTSTKQILLEEGLTAELADAILLGENIDNLVYQLHPNSSETTAPEGVTDLGLNADEKIILTNFISRKHAFKISLSGADGWIEPLDVRVKLEGDILVFNIGLDPTSPAVTFADTEVLGTDYEVDLPFVKIELNPETKTTYTQDGFNAEVCLYQIFRNANFENIEIKTEVNGVTNLLLQNDESLLDPSKPFLPFGTLPNQGANFFLGSAEVFSKKLEALTVNLTWDKLPNFFATHYEMYFAPSALTSEINFNANLEMLKAGSWQPISDVTAESLFEGSPINEVKIITTNENFNTGFSGKKIRPLTPETLNGFVKLQLEAPNGFKHNLYADALKLQAQAIAEKAMPTPRIVVGALYKNNLGVVIKAVAAVPAVGDTPAIPATSINNHTPYLPKEPYTPTVKNFSLNYTATANKKDITFFHLYPFESTFLKKENLVTTLLPKFENADSEGTTTEKEGQLFIGLSNLKPDSIVHLLFQMSESTANPDLDKAELDWYYLRDNEWKLLRKDFEVLQDDTDGLLRSGIVTLAIPRDINQKNTILSSTHHWIKVATAKNSAAVSEVIGVHTQAAKVFFKNQNNDLARLIQPLAAGSIGELKNSQSALSAFSQPYDSFGGQPAETDTHFYTRVSEHLRHKGRGINLYDYERIVLEAFPELYKVKCIPHTLGRKIQFPFKTQTTIDENRDYELSPGFVTLAVIPDLSNLPTANQLQPKVTLAKLEEIKAFLQARISPFVRLQVLNPKYETLKVQTKVVFAKGRSRAFYTEKLKADILEFLTPWVYDAPSRISFGGKVYKSAILNFAEQRDYVDYVFDFKILDQNNVLKNEITPQSARSILVSGQHEIIAADSCSLNNAARIDGEGIGFKRVGNTFQLSDDETPCDPDPICVEENNNTLT